MLKPEQLSQIFAEALDLYLHMRANPSHVPTAVDGLARRMESGDFGEVDAETGERLRAAWPEDPGGLAALWSMNYVLNRLLQDLSREGTLHDHPGARIRRAGAS